MVIVWKWALVTIFLIGFSLGTVYFSLPFSVGAAGFWPGILSTLFSWIFLLFTSFYYLEATLAVEPGSNLYSISRRFLGKWGARISSAIFLGVNYCNLFYFFYIVGPILAKSIANTTGVSLEGNTIILLLGLLVGLSVFLGLTATMIFNAIFFIATCIFYFLSFQKGLDAPPILESLAQRHWPILFLAIPSILNIIYFQPLLPSVTPFLKNRAKPLQWAIIIALAFAFLTFIAWLWLTMVTAAPHDVNSLINLNPDTPFGYETLTKVPVIGKWLPALLVANCLMSLLTTSLMLIDFLADATGVALKERRGLKRALFTVCVLLPSVLLSLIHSKGLLAFSLYVTEIGGVYLSGLLPVLWIWFLRYVHHEKAHRLVPGGKKMLTLLSLLAIFALYLVVLEIFYQMTF